MPTDPSIDDFDHEEPGVVEGSGGGPAMPGGGGAGGGWGKADSAAAAAVFEGLTQVGMAGMVVGASAGALPVVGVFAGFTAVQAIAAGGFGAHAAYIDAGGAVSSRARQARDPERTEGWGTMAPAVEWDEPPPGTSCREWLDRIAWLPGGALSPPRAIVEPSMVADAPVHLAIAAENMATALEQALQTALRLRETVYKVGAALDAGEIALMRKQMRYSEHFSVAAEAGRDLAATAIEDFAQALEHTREIPWASFAPRDALRAAKSGEVQSQGARVWRSRGLWTDRTGLLVREEILEHASMARLPARLTLPAFYGWAGMALRQVDIRGAACEALPHYLGAAR